MSKRTIGRAVSARERRALRRLREAADKDVGGGVDRDKIPEEDFAGPDRTFPIVIPKDVEDASRLIGQADDPEAVKRKIVAIAKRKGAPFVARLPKEWQESRGFELGYMPLAESVSENGTVRIKIIQPGWGTSGYYSREVLERDGGHAWPANTHMYWNHPTVSEAKERPERDLRDLAGVTLSDARWDEKGSAGPGLYATAQVFPAYVETVRELAPYIGLSIRAYGDAAMGEAEGRQGWIIERIGGGESIDFVTQAGAGGRVLGLFEAAGRREDPTHSDTGEDRMDLLQEAQNRIALLEGKLDTAVNEAKAKDATISQLTERAEKAERERDEATKSLTEAKAVSRKAEIVALVEKLEDVPEPARVKIVAAAEAADGEPATVVAEAAKAERAYIAALSGKPVDNGGSTKTGAERLTEAFQRRGMSKEQAERAATR